MIPNRQRDADSAYSDCKRWRLDDLRKGESAVALRENVPACANDDMNERFWLSRMNDCMSDSE